MTLKLGKQHWGLGPYQVWGWLGVEEMSYTLSHRGIQLILAYNWARPAILVAGRGWGHIVSGSLCMRPLHFLMHSITSEPCMLGF